MADNVVEQFIATRHQLDRAAGLLTIPTPPAMDECARILREAAAQLTECRTQAEPVAGDASAMEEVWLLRRSLTRAGRLLQHAAEFHAGWGRIRGAMAGGYTSSGEAAAVSHGSRICLQG